MPVDNPDGSILINNVDPVPLYTCGAEYPMWLYTMMLSTRGKLSGSSDVTLATKGMVKSAGGIPLYAQGSPFGQQYGEGTAPLSSRGWESSTGNTTLFVSGPKPATNDVPLVAKTAAFSWGSVPLYAMNGVRAINSIGLASQGGSRPNASGSTNLTSKGGGTAASQSLKLSASVAGSGGPSASLGMIAAGGMDVTRRTLSLFASADRPTNGALPLYARGPVGRPGAIPASKSLGLRVERGPAAGMTLVVGGPSSASSLGMATRGAATSSAQSPMFVRGDDGKPKASLTLAVPASTSPAPLARALNLSLPKVKGVEVRKAPLSTQGWNTE